jgi:4'-phosphopantetheinyl transferase
MTEWRVPGAPVLLSGAVHLWFAPLAEPPERVRELLDHLPPDEVARAAQFRFERDRNEFIVAHAALRTVLGSYLNQQPDRIALDRNPYGKPVLARAIGLEFNLSHTRGIALIALALNRRIGVDVEFVRDDLALDDLADTFFSPAERRALAALSGADRIHAFYRCWCRKEAYLKARGLGLNLPLDSFDVLSDEASSGLKPADTESPIDGWSFLESDVGPAHVCSLATEGFCETSEHFHWSSGFPRR